MLTIEIAAGLVILAVGWLAFRSSPPMYRDESLIIRQTMMDAHYEWIQIPINFRETNYLVNLTMIEVKKLDMSIDDYVRLILIMENLVDIYEEKEEEAYFDFLVLVEVELDRNKDSRDTYELTPLMIEEIA